MVAITKGKVLEKLKGLKVDKLPGPNGLHLRVLKDTAEEIVEALVVIFQESLESGRVLEDWKIINITSLFKKGVRQTAGNYRPISLTSVVGKILESIVKDEISEYLEVHDEGTEGILATFADDTKINDGTSSIEEVGRLQKNLDRLAEREKKWQMEYIESFVRNHGTSLRLGIVNGARNELDPPDQPSADGPLTESEWSDGEGKAPPLELFSEKGLIARPRITNKTGRVMLKNGRAYQKVTFERFGYTSRNVFSTVSWTRPGSFHSRNEEPANAKWSGMDETGSGA
eukprot:g36701.t1